MIWWCLNKVLKDDWIHEGDPNQRQDHNGQKEWKGSHREKSKSLRRSMRYKKVKQKVGRGQISNSQKANFVVPLIHRFFKGHHLSTWSFLQDFSHSILASLSSYQFDHPFCSSLKAPEAIQLHEVFLKQV